MPDRAVRMLERIFGRASMVAKLSMIFNILTIYALLTFYQRTNSLSEEIVKCHNQRYEDMASMMTKLTMIKDTAEVNKETVDQIKTTVEEVKTRQEEVKQALEIKP